MAFEPFGYRFEVNSTKSPAEVKAVLRAGMKGWFEAKNGARGWIVGPFICLWHTAFNQYGPSLIGRISQDGFGSRVSGRAGSNLGGMALFVAMWALLALIIYLKTLAQGTSIGAFLLASALWVGSALLVFWIAHNDRRQADPLVNFIRRSLGIVVAKRRRPTIAPDPTDYLPMRLMFSVEDEHAMPATPSAIREAIDAISDTDGGFIVIEREHGHFMQAAARTEGFVLEKRNGSDASHFAAKRGDSELLSPDEIADVLISYLADRPLPQDLSWHPAFFRWHKG